MVRDLNQDLGTNVALLADLQGPKIRTGEIENNGVLLEEGKKLTISAEEVLGTAEHISINYKDLPNDVNEGERILLDDGKLELKVISSDGNEIHAEVVHGGILSWRKGVNLPNTVITMPCLTPKDMEDLEFALAQNVDWIGLSFVRSARDIIELRHLISAKQGKAKVIAKIEKPEALEDINTIITECDALMVARGDFCLLYTSDAADE